MITVVEAINAIQLNSKPLSKSVKLPIENAVGSVLFNNIISPIYMPPFRQSAMDGYAVRIHDKSTYEIIDEVKAGDAHHPILKIGEAVRIFTGAPVPDTADAVVIQENTSTSSGSLEILKQVSKHDNIRPKGEQVSKDQIALEKGCLLTPAAIGFISSLGITEVEVFQKPSIAILVTGNELVRPGEDLNRGQIYESNGIMLDSMLKSLSFDDVSKYKVADDYPKTIELLDKLILQKDVVIISGGISVGDYDYVGKALAKLDVTELFYKVRQKPGKPLFFGKKDNTLIFALPGNPAAALSCCYFYVYPALQKSSGHQNFELQKLMAVSESNFTKKGDRAQFLKAYYQNGTVKILDGQSSAMMQTFACSNALVFVNETQETIRINDSVEVILLPIN